MTKRELKKSIDEKVRHLEYSKDITSAYWIRGYNESKESRIKKIESMISTLISQQTDLKFLIVEAKKQNVKRIDFNFIESCTLSIEHCIKELNTVIQSIERL